MKPLRSLALGVLGALLICCSAVNRSQAQAKPATPPQAEAQKPAPSAQEPEDEEENLFIPEPSPTLPPGMTEFPGLLCEYLHKAVPHANRPGAPPLSI